MGKMAVLEAVLEVQMAVLEAVLEVHMALYTVPGGCIYDPVYGTRRPYMTLFTVSARL